MSEELAVQFLEACTQHRDEAGLALQFDTTALPALCDVKAVPGRVSAVLPVTPAVSNRYGTLHGGCIATLVDTVGSAALVTASPKGGVSLNINVNYLSKVATGGRVLIEAQSDVMQVVKVGKTIATIEVYLRDEASGALVAQGTHVKFIAEQEPTMASLLSHQGQQQQQQQQQQGAAAGRRTPGIRSRL
ncbi:hypothetical protein CHLNCDRAFT_135083 [Chlorella variabilis]|uniref:Thioesterase domain-containing protein n=1 Tax=Chlorella variabilis TaxID=554065 RepID=E1ZHH0_CHLVA|nr:hypothetical protein CHLNCDRAFT_135083 [Chlorella variabilis]EFN54601.1 hypothetical protein CHLNCDRAFT_135083 [Chlorella variabilis]|eukprot:XP_005846703.1 hypothetical protein CHLNCDRAFT_135083 [Chlorella variabilis]